MRGKLFCHSLISSAYRITPADAGKTTSYPPSSVYAVDHPRGCGENNRADKVRLDDIGSPPRMRGKRSRCAGRKRSGRITPADAGKTPVSRGRTFLTWDHPRGCGENPRRTCSAAAEIGSPPRMRGKLISVRFSILRIRITPADAGKTNIPTLLFKSAQDHPRGCGENRKPRSKSPRAMGSPPRMRGKRYAVTSSEVISRITPADAGKTRRCHQHNCQKEDHPRGCGENFQPHLVAAFGAGSPPRMRGKPLPVSRG